MKSTFQQIKWLDNRRFLQADMAESPKVANAEILDSKQCWSETAIAPSDSDKGEWVPVGKVIL
jgi:hypothetical protein